MRFQRSNDRCIDELSTAMEVADWNQCGARTVIVRCPDSGVETTVDPCQANYLTEFRGWERVGTVPGGPDGAPGLDERPDIDLPVPDLSNVSRGEAAAAGGVGLGAAWLLGLL